MTRPAELRFLPNDPEAIAGFEGRVALVVGDRLDALGRRVNRLSRGAVERLVASEAWGKMKPGDARELAFPAGLAAEALQVVKLPRGAGRAEARKAGVAIGRAVGGRPILVLAGAAAARADDIALGAVLRSYAFEDHKTEGRDERKPAIRIAVMVPEPGDADERAADVSALAQGVFLTRDLTNAPANVLTTSEFASRLDELHALGLEVEVLDEDALEALGMRTLLAVGMGSESPSKVVVMQWKGGGDAKPLALVGKGVVFDTGGISIKPAQGMEEMTGDMGGAAVVAGTMMALALRRAKANVVGIVGLVENMPDGRAQRPGDVVVSMKGDTVEVINTDAEGRLVLADVLWYTQDRFDPAGIIDLATLTGAVVIALGHENAGVFSNDDAFCDAFLAAAKAEGEGAWRLPLGEAYDKALKSDIADFKNVGGRPAGAITAAQFLKRFVKDGMPWIHLDIAGVSDTRADSAYGPKGASGWGVLALDRLIRDRYQG